MVATRVIEMDTYELNGTLLADHPHKLTEKGWQAIHKRCERYARSQPDISFDELCREAAEPYFEIWGEELATRVARAILPPHSKENEMDPVPIVPGEVVGEGPNRRVRAKCPRCDHTDEYGIGLQVGGNVNITGPEPCKHCGRDFRIEMPPGTFPIT